MKNMCTSDLIVDRIVGTVSNLLELSAADDLERFRSVIEQEGFDIINESGLWYGQSIGSKRMMLRLEERTPLMIASMFGSKNILNFILSSNHVEINKFSGSDQATALHMAVSGGSTSMIEVIKRLIESNADINRLDAHNHRPVDLIPLVLSSSLNPKRKLLELLLNGSSCSDSEELRVLTELTEGQKSRPILFGSAQKEYPVDLSLPDMKNGVYSTDEFRMYAFKIKPCSRAYSHDWTECPFVHPGENARRRDPQKYHYSCVPCPDFRKGSCQHGDSCEYAHGIFESWLHPAQYRTRLCKDEVGCNRKVCFFAHKPDELRPLHPSTGSGWAGPVCPSPLSPTRKVVSSRFKTNLDLEAELIMVDRYRKQQMMEEFVGLSSPSSLNNNNSTLANVGFGFSGDYFEEYNVPAGLNQKSLFGANNIMNSRSNAFVKRSQSFIDRGTIGFSSRVSTMVPSKLSDWGSPDGKLNWGIEKDELNKLRKSASFGVRRSPDSSNGLPESPWFSDEDNRPGIRVDEDECFPSWVEQPYMEQEQLVA